MSKLAVDVVLLPPEEIMNIAIAANASADNPKLVKKLNKVDCLPHISLLQGVMEVSEQPVVEQALAKAATFHKPLQLVLTQLETMTLSDGLITSGFKIGLTPELQRLHESIAKGLENTIGKGATEDMFFERPIRQGMLNYVNEFRTRHAFEHFGPHLTICVGGTPTFVPALPISFNTSVLTLCHLGSAGTCRKVLASFELNKKK